MPRHSVRRPSLRTTPIATTLAVTTLAATPLAASADIVIDLQNASWLGGDFTMYLAPGEFEGVLEAISLVDVVCDAGPQVAALTAYLSPGPFDADALAGLDFSPSPGGRLQVGGPASPLSIVDLDAFETGSWTAVAPPNFVLDDTYTIANGGFDVDGLGFMLGNGIVPPPSGGIERFWSGSIVLHGVNHVPSAGALALAGVAGLLVRGVARRRS